MKIELDSILISGFRDIGENQFVQFKKNSLYSIIGKNEDEGGSNAAGKSSFVMAVAVAFFGAEGAAVPLKRLKNRYTNTPARLQISATIDGQRLMIDRTLGGKLQFKLNDGEWQTGKSDDVQQAINRILKITPKQFLMLSNKPQEGEFGGFLLMKDSEKKDFLGSFFDLKDLDSAYEINSKKLQASKQDMTGIQYKLELMRQSVKSSEERTSTLTKEAEDAAKAAHSIHDKETELHLFREEVASLEDKLNNFENSIQQDQDFLKFTAKELELSEKYDFFVKNTAHEISRLNEEIGALSKKIAEPIIVPDQLTLKLQQTTSALNNCSVQLKQKQRLSIEIAQQQKMLIPLKDQLTKLYEHKCYACGQETHSLQNAAMQTELNNKISVIEQDLTTKNTEFESIQASEEALKILSDMRDTAVANIEIFKKENSVAHLQQAVKDLKAKKTLLESSGASIQSSLKDSKDAVIRYKDGAKTKISYELKSNKAKISLIEDSIVNIRMNSSRVSEALSKAQLDLANKMAELRSIENSYNELVSSIEVMEAIDLILSRNGFFGYIFDSILGELNDLVNENIKLFPNVRKYSLIFSSDKVAKTTGNTTKSITYKLYSDAHEVDFGDLSGGEKLSVITAVDEALDTVLSRRLGVQIGWKFLDEQFPWTDQNSKESILEFFRQKSSQKTYFIIDHASEMNAAMDSAIHLVKRNNIAEIAQ